MRTRAFLCFSSRSNEATADALGPARGVTGSICWGYHEGLFGQRVKQMQLGQFIQAPATTGLLMLEGQSGQPEQYWGVTRGAQGGCQDHLLSPFLNTVARKLFARPTAESASGSVALEQTRRAVTVS